MGVGLRKLSSGLDHLRQSQYRWRLDSVYDYGSHRGTWGGALIVIPFIGIMGLLHNSWFHTIYSVTDTYSPGTVTSLVPHLPLASYGGYRFYATGQISVWELVLAFVLGGLIHHNLFRSMRKKMEAAGDNGVLE